MKPNEKSLMATSRYPLMAVGNLLKTLRAGFIIIVLVVNRACFMSLPFYVNWSKGPDLPLFLAAGHLATWNRGTAGSFSAHFSI